ncbi:MAG: hypothetical protein WCW31_02020 [Patescibacteria group bacterium]
MQFKNTLVGLFAVVLVASAAALTYYSYSSKQSQALDRPVPQNQIASYKATPVFVKQNPVNNLLLNGENELYSFTLGTQLNKSIAFKQIALKVQKSADVSVSKFKLYKNSKALASQDYSVMDGSTGLDLEEGLATSDVYVIAVIALKGEEVIYGSGNTYTVKATVKSDLMKKSYIMTSAYRLGDGEVVKGYLSNAVAQPFTAASQGVFSVKKTPDLKTAMPGFFIWSDKSSAAHSASVTNLSSGDWFSDYDDGSLDGQPTTINSK